MYLLDTNIISYWIRGDLSLIEKIKTYSPQDLSISTITLAEIYYGIEKSVKKKERRTKIGLIKSQLEMFTFNELAAEKYGRLRSTLEKKGLPISERDMQIAAIAFANKLILVTHNVREFSRIDELEVEDWAEE